MTFKALITEKTDDGYQSRVGDKNLEDLPEGDVLVRVAWSSLNYKDALSASGNKGVTRSFPHTPGIDAAGVVEEAGDGPFSVGDAVICTGYDLGMNTSGGYGDYIRVPAEWLAPLPAGLSARDAMVLGTAGLTAALCVEALIDTGLQPEQGEVLVTGATGGVGNVAVSILSNRASRWWPPPANRTPTTGCVISAPPTSSADALLEGIEKPVLKPRWPGWSIAWAAIFWSTR